MLTRLHMLLKECRSIQEHKLGKITFKCSYWGNVHTSGAHSVSFLSRCFFSTCWFLLSSLQDSSIDFWAHASQQGLLKLALKTTNFLFNKSCHFTSGSLGCFLFPLSRKLAAMLCRPKILSYSAAFILAELLAFKDRDICLLLGTWLTATEATGFCLHWPNVPIVQGCCFFLQRKRHTELCDDIFRINNSLFPWNTMLSSTLSFFTSYSWIEKNIPWGTTFEALHRKQTKIIIKLWETSINKYLLISFLLKRDLRCCQRKDN